MSFFQAIILGIVEGITEFLPISSTAHMLITQHFMGIVSTDFVKTFTIVIQLGAIGAIMMLYVTRIKFLWNIWFKIAWAFVPTGIVGLFFYKRIQLLLDGNNIFLLWALGIGGIIIVIFEFFKTENPALSTKDHDVERELRDLSLVKATMIGIAQSISVIPGVSRSAATIIAGRAFGLSRKAIVEFSFLLAIPTMIIATLYSLYKTAPRLSLEHIDLLIVGLVTSFMSAYITIRWLMNFIKKHNFIMFGFYRILLALALIPFFL